VGALARLQEEGKIQHVGLSNVGVAEIQAAREIVNVVSVQNRCNPFDRDSFNSGVVAFCTRENIAFLPHSPVGGHKGHMHSGGFCIVCCRRSPWNKPLPGLHSLAFSLIAKDAPHPRREPH
jgi:predicted oxidoreductase